MGASGGAPGPDTETRGRDPRWRLGIVLWLLGLPGVLAVAWALLGPLSSHVGLLPMAPWAMAVISGLQMAAMLAVAVLVGVLLAPPVGLSAPAVSAWLQGRPVAPALRRQWTPGVLGGVAGALWLWGLSWFTPAALRPADPGAEMPLLVKLLYGGITEELLMRWGLMSLLLWLAWRLLQRGRGAPGGALVALAVVASAVLFGVGHLPAAQALAGALTPEVLLYVLAGNAVFGIVAGVLYARHGLEAAMLAHVLAHALSHPVL